MNASPGMRYKMAKFTQWLNDLRWAANMKRIRRFERTLTFSERELFYNELKPILNDGTVSVRVSYPNAFMFITIDDIVRAIEAVAYHRMQNYANTQMEMTSGIHKPMLGVKPDA